MDTIDPIDPNDWTSLLRLCRYWARRRGAKPELADDIAQDVACTLHRLIQDGEAPATIGYGYLRRAVHNRVIEAWRVDSAMERRLPLVERLDEAPAAEDPLIAAEEERCRVARSEALWRAVYRLPGRMREVTLLRLQGLEDAAIAALLGSTPVAVRKAAFDARRRLARDRDLAAFAV